MCRKAPDGRRRPAGATEHGRRRRGGTGAFQERFGLSGQYLAGPQAGEGYPGMRRVAVELTVQR